MMPVSHRNSACRCGGNRNGPETGPASGGPLRGTVPERQAGLILSCAVFEVVPLGRWLRPRREAIAALAQAHAQLGEVGGLGRLLEIGRPVAHAYVLRVVAEFQAFSHDLHDLAAETMVRLSGASASSQAILIAAATGGRMIDRGNADLRSLEMDFRRIGITGVSGRIAVHSTRWSSASAWRGDQACYRDLIELRNALAHGNQQQVDRLRSRESWTRCRGRGPGCLVSTALRVPWTVSCGLRSG